MRIYNLLIYNGYLLAVKSRNFEGLPILGSLMYVAPCIMLNIFALLLFLQGLDIFSGINLPENFKFVFSGILLLILTLYYSINNRFKKIIERYKIKYRNKKQVHPIIIFFIYFIISFLLLIVAGAFYNKSWIFTAN